MATGALLAPLWVGLPCQSSREGKKPDPALYLKVDEKITRQWTDNYFNRKDYLKTPAGRLISRFYCIQDSESSTASYGPNLKNLLDLSQEVAESKVSEESNL
jgi:hypothetical protein